MCVMEMYFKPLVQQPREVSGSDESSDQTFWIGKAVDVELIHAAGPLLVRCMDGCVEPHCGSTVTIVRSGAGVGGFLSSFPNRLRRWRWALLRASAPASCCCRLLPASRRGRLLLLRAFFGPLHNYGPNTGMRGVSKLEYLFVRNSQIINASSS